MKTIEVELSLMRYYDFLRNYIVTNVTDRSGLVRCESDVLVVTKSGYATSIEIKVTKADLKNDHKKRWYLRVYNAHGDGSDRGVLNENIRKFYFNGIGRKYYAVPESLSSFALSFIPDWCGLISISEDGFYRVTIIRNACVLYPEKWSDSKILNLLRIGTIKSYALKRTIFFLDNGKSKNDDKGVSGAAKE
jgi:hypothetical protein